MTDLRNLPAEVLERLGNDPSGIDARQRGNVLEARLTKVEVRADGDDAEIDGYATVYDYPYDVAGGPPWGWAETIAAGAATKSVQERDDVRLLLNHDGLPLARTRANTLHLESDDVGLHIAAKLDTRSTLVRDIVSAMERGDLDEMSFAFQALRQEWNEDYTERRILEVKLFDVSLVTYPANPATVAQVRDEAPSAAVGMSLAYARALADRSRLAVA